MKTVTHYALVCMLTLTCAVLAAGCKNDNSQASGKKQQDAKVFPVEVTRAAYENVQHTLEAVGSFFPEDEVKVGAEVEGTIKKLSVDEGAIVKKGDLLLEIDDEKFRLEVEESDAMMTEGLRKLDNARATLNRMTRLYKEGVIGEQNYDDTKTQTLLIEANVENIKARLNRFKKSLRSTEESCTYEVEVRKALYHSTTYERVLVRPGETTKLNAVLVKQYSGTVQYPDEKDGAK